MPSISQRVRTAVQAQLSDLNTGFNQNFTSALSSYKLDPSLIRWNGIQWTPPTQTFMYGRISPEILQNTEIMTFPFCSIDTLSAMHTNMVISATFAGQVQPVIDFHISWEPPDLLPDFASYSDAVEDAMFTTINNLSKQNYGTNMIYNGRMSITRGAIVQGGFNWRQTLVFLPEFRVVTI